MSYPHDKDDLVFGDPPRVSLLMELTDRMGILHDVLKYFWKYEINVTRIESRPVAFTSSSSLNSSSSSSTSSPLGGRGGKRTYGQKFDFYMDFDGTLEDPVVQKLLNELKPMTTKLLLLDEKDVHWFPRHISELDAIANRTLDAGIDLTSEENHPGFHDPEYRKRREVLASNARTHTWDRPIPFIEYTIDEKETWGRVWDRMEDLWERYACKEFLVRAGVSECGIKAVSSLSLTEYRLVYSLTAFSIPWLSSRNIAGTVVIRSPNNVILVTFSIVGRTLRCDPSLGCYLVVTF